MTGYVSRIIDGDTFEISSGYRIRLADVDCPEYYESGYSQATNYLAGLISGKKVYLDIDDLYRTDPYDRLVCVVYVDDGGRRLNVNKALLNSGNAKIDDYPNEFSPYSWSLYEGGEGIGSFINLIILIGVLFVLYRIRSSKKKQPKQPPKPKVCPNCRWANAINSSYCTYCGQKLD